MLLEIGLLKRKQKKRNQNCIKSGLSEFLFLQQKMYNNNNDNNNNNNNNNNLQL